jgi:C1A family cysteine protease
MKILRSFLLFCAVLFPAVIISFPLEAFPVFTRPAGEEFARFRENPSVRRTASARPLGYRPSPLDLSHVRSSASLRSGLDILAAGAGGTPVFPRTFDLRELGALTPVRDQNPYGTCWAFASLASLESTFLKAGKGAFDFSEWHLAYFAYVDEEPALPAFTAIAPGFGSDPIFDQGGSVFQSAALLARWTGAVAESDRPYQDISPWPESGRPRASDRAAKRLENVYLIDGEGIDGEGLLDPEAVKYALMRWGAVSVRVVWNDGAYSEDHFSYYNVPESGGGHIVTIVGWDDTFPAGNFVSDPGRDGAWIVRNSWGADWGEEGYFHLSYAEPTLGYPAVFLGGNSGTFDRIYQYDPLGWVAYVGFGRETAWFANIFESRGNETLEAVSFYAPAPDASFRVEVRRGGAEGDPVSGELVSVMEDILGPSGYHTVRLTRNVPLSGGERFSVAVRIVTPDFLSPVPVESRQGGYSDKADAEPGQSFISVDGATWTDLTTLPGHEKSNVCLKAFTSVSSSGGGCSFGGESGVFGLLLLLPLVPVLRKRGK